MKLPEVPSEILNYALPASRIADRPLAKRDHSKLLFFRDHKIKDYRFFELPEIISPDSLIVANNTRVIPARLLFQKDTGTSIEVFLLEAITSDWSQWTAMVGNRKKFRNGEKLFTSDTAGNILEVSWIDRDSNTICLHSNSSMSLQELIFSCGAVPLPPYIKRAADEADKENYQTVFAEKSGAVAAPTASLHFTDEVLNHLHKKGITTAFVTLHVGAGTFVPVTTNLVSDHTMHAESFELDVMTLRLIIQQLENGKPIIAVGTTSMRLLESIYYIGLNLINHAPNPFYITSEIAFRLAENKPDTLTCLKYLESYLSEKNQSCSGKTAIFILPGFPFRVCNALITNFHQPGSTLIALVYAFVGEVWKDVYRHALENEYRFLSYGDSSILWRDQS